MASKLLEIIELIKAAKDNKGNIAVTLIILCALGSTGSYYAHENILHPIMDNVYKVDTYDFYRYVEFDLSKQAEKLIKDPNDVRDSDVRKFKYYCNSYFGNEYKVELEADRQATITKVCKVISEKYKELT